MSAKRVLKNDKPKDADIIDDTATNPEEGALTLQDSIARALEAARLADDAAEDIDSIRKSNEAVIETMKSSQKRTSALAIGAAAGAFVAAVISGLVYFRSVGDLREASLMQAETMKALAEQTLSLQEVVALAGEQSATLGPQMSEFQTTLMDDLNVLVGETAAMQPQMASAIQGHTDNAIAGLRDELVAMVNDLDMSLTKVMAENLAQGSGGISPELIKMIGDIKTELSAAPARSTTAAASPARSSTPTRSTPSRPAQRPARAAEANPFSFP